MSQPERAQRNPVKNVCQNNASKWMNSDSFAKMVCLYGHITHSHLVRANWTNFIQKKMQQTWIYFEYSWKSHHHLFRIFIKNVLLFRNKQFAGIFRNHQGRIVHSVVFWPFATMAQSGPAPAAHPRRHRPDPHQMEPNNGPGGPPIIPARFSETDWEARDVSSTERTRPSYISFCPIHEINCMYIFFPTVATSTWIGGGPSSCITNGKDNEVVVGLHGQLAREMEQSAQWAEQGARWSQTAAS